MAGGHTTMKAAQNTALEAAAFIRPLKQDTLPPIAIRPSALLRRLYTRSAMLSAISDRMLAFHSLDIHDFPDWQERLSDRPAGSACRGFTLTALEHRRKLRVPLRHIGRFHANAGHESSDEKL
jgi:hypothetical protein